MPELNATVSESFISAIQNGAQEAASAFSRTFGFDVVFEPVTAGVLDLAVLKEKFSLRGLAMTLLTEGKAILILIPAVEGLIPDWCDNPDATGKSKLSTFAQELGMNLVPDDFFPEDFRAEIVPDLAQAAENGKIGDQPGYAELLIVRGAEKTTVCLLWPIQEIGEVFAAAAATGPASQAAPASGPAPLGAGAGSGFGLPGGFSPAPPFGGTFAPFSGGPDFSASSDLGELDHEKRLSPEELPGFSRNILKVRVPVAAVLARARRSIKTILELGVGSVIQFDKSCDDPLELEVDRTVIANGEAVKVGDKFGIRLNDILLPKERFRPVEVRREGEYKKRQHRAPQIIGKAPIKSLEPQQH